MKIIDSLNWRYATTDFDSSKQLSDEQLENLKKIVRLSPSSWGFQFYKIIVIEDKNMKEKLLPAAYNQSQITDCSHLFVFCSYKEVFESDIDQLISDMHDTRKNDADYDEEGINSYGEGSKKIILNMDKGKQLEWLKKQCYIALGQLMVGCADMRIDACPMEGFKNEEFDKILELEDKNLISAVIYLLDLELQKISTNTDQSLGSLQRTFLKIYKFVNTLLTNYI